MFKFKIKGKKCSYGNRKCKARCKDGTSCLNKAKYSGYCKKHTKLKINVRR